MTEANQEEVIQADEGIADFEAWLASNGYPACEYENSYVTLGQVRRWLAARHRRLHTPEAGERLDDRPDIQGSPLCKIMTYNWAHEDVVRMGYPSLTEALEHLDELKAGRPPEVEALVEAATKLSELVGAKLMPGLRPALDDANARLRLALSRIEETGNG